MINRIILSIFITLFFTSSGFAETLIQEKLKLHWSILPDPTYTPIPKRTPNHPHFVPFVDWQDLEIVRQGKINWSNATLTNENTWTAGNSLLSMRDLVLQSFDIFTPGITPICNGLIIPFAIDILYVEKDDFGMGYVSTDTINVFGAIKVINEKVEDIKILHFYDSNEAVRKIGFLKRYGSAFVEGIVSPLLKNYLSKDQNEDKLLSLIVLRTGITQSDTTCDETGEMDIQTQVNTFSIEEIDTIIREMDFSSDDKKVHFLKFLVNIKPEYFHNVYGGPPNHTHFDFKAFQNSSPQEQVIAATTFIENLRNTILASPENDRRDFVGVLITYEITEVIIFVAAEGLGKFMNSMAEGIGETMVNTLSKVMADSFKLASEIAIEVNKGMVEQQTADQ